MPGIKRCQCSFEMSKAAKLKSHNSSTLRNLKPKKIPKQITGWWYTYPSEKYESVGMVIPNIWKNKKCSKPPTRWVHVVRCFTFLLSTFPPQKKPQHQHPPPNLQSMDWFKGKSTGNHRFSHEIWGFPVKFFPRKPIHWTIGGVDYGYYGGLLGMDHRGFP